MAKGLLFSDYYLTEGLRHTQEYISVADQHVAGLYKELETLYRHFALRREPDEADTEDDLIRPILEKLGFYYSRQKSPSKKGRGDVPDFVLFASREDKDVFDASPQNSRPWSRVVCILEGKRWKRPLDSGDKTDPIDQSVPSNQMLRYLSAVEVASNGRTVWGILTNGATWRLYYQRYPSRSDGYVEFDLNDILHDTLTKFVKPTDEMLDIFRAFLLMFRKEAFVPTDWRPQKSFLELALDDGKKWEERIAGSLTDKTFLQVFPLLAKGTVENSRARGNEPDERLLDEIYGNILIFLYRLLFLFYAEDRNLLPVSTLKYRGYSLSQMRQEIADLIDNQVPLSKSATTYWDKLKSLFKIINKGDSVIGIPPYNGGLFNPAVYPFLENNSIPDNCLAPAIDCLSRESVDGMYRRINYRDLSVRQLGSIYEGLLEFRIRIAATNLTIKKVGKKEIYEPAKSDRKIAVSQGEIYLTNDRSERKASGSYFTPDEIVQYIVRNLLERLIEDRRQEFLKKKSQLTASAEFRRKSPKWKNQELNKLDIAVRVLDMKILDPAMGSGHFLVGVVDYLSDRILEMLAEFNGETFFGNVKYVSPLAGRLENLRRNIRKGAVQGNYSVDESKLDDKSLIRRVILKKCIYGVDINPLAVELAKVALWLHTFTAGATLTFLDHHLKCGNSLVQASSETLTGIAGGSVYQAETASLKTAIERIGSLEKLTDIDLSEVELSNQIHNDVSRDLEPFKRLFDLCVADLFTRPKVKSGRVLPNSPINLLDGSKGDPIEIVNGNVELMGKDKQIFESAMELCRTQSAFHWQLEFPEIWPSSKDGPLRGGFDAVLGNPPYVSFGLGRVGKLDERTEQYLRKAFPSSAEYKISTYALFMELAIRLSREGGLQSYILPDSFLVGRFFYKIRSCLLENDLNELLRFDEDFWEEGDVGFPVIWIGQKGPSPENHSCFTARFVESPEQLALGNFSSRKIEKEIPLMNKRRRIRLIREENDARLVEKIESTDDVLSDWLDMHHGIRSKSTRESLLSRDPPKGDKRWKKGLVESNQVTPFNVDYRDDFIVIDPNLLYSGGWDALSIESPKMLIRRTGDLVIAAVDTCGYYHTNALIYGRPLPLEATYEERVLTLWVLSAILNSQLFAGYYRTVTGKKGRTFPQVEIDNLGELSIPNLAEPKEIPAALLQILNNTRALTGPCESSSNDPTEARAPLNEASHTSQEALALLARRMDELTSERRRISSSFIDWLTVSTHSNPAMWKNKGLLYDSPLPEFDRLLALLIHNEDVSALRPAKRSEDLQVLRENYDKAREMMRPVLESTKETMSMINRLVYHLYDLDFDKDVFSI